MAYAGGLGGFDESIARISIATLVYAVARRKDLPEYKATLDYLKQRLEQQSQQQWLEYGRYYQAQALFQGDLDAWEKWNKLLVRQLKQAQKPDGSFQGQFGPSLTTSFSLLALALNYRFLAHLRTVDHALASSRADRRGPGDVAGASLAGRLLALMAWLLGRPCRPAGAEPRRHGPAEAVLHLTNGGYVPGELVPAERAGRCFAGKPTSFVAPFDFALAGVNAVHFPVPASLPGADGRLLLRAGGRRCPVRLADRAGRDARPSSTSRGSGGSTSQRSVINRMYRWKSSADLIYLGPNGLAGWHETSAKKVWKEEQGQPWTDQDGAAIRGDFKLPARATLEFEISWKNKPDFVLALGVGDDEKTIQRAFRFEVWERDLIIQRETEQEADVASVGEIAPGSGRIHLIAYLDQEKGRILVFSADGKPLADLKVARRPAAGPGQHLAGQQAGRPAAGAAADRPVERRAAARGRERPVAHPPGGRLDRLRTGQPLRRGLEGVRDRRRQGRVPDSRGSDRGRLPVACPGDEAVRALGRGLPGRITAERRRSSEWSKPL